MNKGTATLSKLIYYENILEFYNVKENLWSELTESRPALLTQATEMKIDSFLGYAYDHAYPELKIPVELQSEIEDLLTTKVYGWSTAENFEVPYEIIIEMFIASVESVCQKHDYDRAHLHYISKELNDHAIIPDSSLIFVEASIRAKIAHEHLKNELICDGYSLKQANDILPWRCDLEKQFQIDAINCSCNF